jgi:hypothetical protein
MMQNRNDPGSRQAFASKSWRSERNQFISFILEAMVFVWRPLRTLNDHDSSSGG